MWPTLLLLADQAAAPEASGGQPPWLSFAPWILILVAFYFIMIMPMRRQEKQRKAQIATLKKNDKIINRGGIIGIVDSIKEKEDEVVLRGGVRITLSSIERVVPEDAGKEQKAGGA
jgi:preprotein translocase subunit YajC